MRLLTEAGVRRLVRRVCEGEGLTEPHIFFIDGRISHTHREGITLSSPAWVAEHHAGSAMAYRLLVLHELAHWARPREGHTPRFYHELYLLCLTYGVPVSFAYDDEVKYRPRAARQGLDRLVA